MATEHKHSNAQSGYMSLRCTMVLRRTGLHPSIY